MTPAQKTNAALTDVCDLLLYGGFNFTPEQVANLAKDIPGEYAAMLADQERRRALTLSKESNHE